MWFFDSYPPEAKLSEVVHYSQMSQSRLTYGQSCVHFSPENGINITGGSRIPLDYHLDESGEFHILFMGSVF